MRSAGGDEFSALARADEEPLEPLCADAARALHGWNFCRGGRLELLPLYHAVYGVDDWELFTDLMAVINDRMPTGLR